MLTFQQYFCLRAPAGTAAVPMLIQPGLRVVADVASARELARATE